MTRIRCALLFFLIAGCAGRDGTPVRQLTAALTSGSVDVSNEPGPQSETWIALDPTLPGHFIGGSNDANPSLLGPMRVYESFDNGASFTSKTLPLPGVCNDQCYGVAAYAAHPGVAFDGSGNAYYCFIGVAALGQGSTLACTRKAVGGSAFSTNLATVPNFNADRPLVTADRTGSAYKNRVYVAWNNNNSTGTQDLMLARSSDSLASFNVVKVNDSGTAVTGAVPAVGPDGEVYVAWSNYGSTTHAIYIDRSTDGGVTFGADHAVHAWAAATGSGVGLKIPADPVHGVGIFPAMDVDRSFGPHRGTIYVAYNDVTATNGLDVFLRRSTDGGVTWSAPMRVNDDPTGTVQDQFLPAVAVDDADGTVVISWYDTRADPANQKAHVMYTWSKDGGFIFVPNVAVTTAPSDESVAGADANGYGDYAGIAVLGGVAQPMWTDSSSGNEEIYTAAVTIGAPTPDFALTASPTAQTVTQGHQISYSISAPAAYGFGSTIDLSVTGIPQGVDVLWPDTVDPNGTVKIFVNGGTATPGTYKLKVTGVSGALSHSVDVTLTVTAPPGFTLSMSPTYLDLLQGDNGSVTIGAQGSSGFDSDVTFTLSGLPAGVSGSFWPAKIAAPGTGATSLLLIAYSTATAGPATVTITASGGGVVHTAQLSLTVYTGNKELLVNGGFEGSLSPWIESGNAYYSSGGLYPHGGIGYAYLGYTNNASGFLYQDFTVPPVGATLTFWLNIASLETTTTYVYDSLTVDILDAYTGFVRGHIATYSNLNHSSGYVQKSISLDAYSGSRVRLRFSVKNDGSYPTTFRIDDASVK
jgi:hypothetical protein